MRVELASHVLAAAIVLTCLSTSGDTYVLPDDLVLPTLTHRHHRRQQQQQQQGKAAADGADAFRVVVKPEYTVMHHGKQVRVNCTAATTNEQPYISFFVSPPFKERSQVK